MPPCGAGVLEKPLHFQFVMGLPEQVIPATSSNLIHLVKTARSLDPAYIVSAFAAGLADFPIITRAAIRGAANIRTGMEDNINISKGTLAKKQGGVG